MFYVAMYIGIHMLASYICMYVHICGLRMHEGMGMCGHTRGYVCTYMYVYIYICIYECTV